MKTQRAKSLAQQHARLGRRLRELRVQAGLGGIEAGHKAGLSQSKISRIENCRFLPNAEDIERLLTVYDATPHQRDEVLGLARDVQEMSKRSRVVLPRGAAQLQSAFRQLDATSSAIRSYSPAMVLGVLQTPAYCRTVFSAALEGEDLEQAVAARLARRAAIETDDSRQLVLLMSEGALRWQAGDALLMTDQIDAIIEASRRPNLSVGIIPWTRPVDVFCTHSFDLYDSTAVLVGTEISSAVFTDAADVETYEHVFSSLQEVASWDDAARRELLRLRTDYSLLT